MRYAGYDASTSQVTQLVSLAVQVRQVALHAAHVDVVVLATYWPIGHTNVHVPAKASYSPPVLHEVQPLELPKMHVAHEASHATHELPDWNLPSGQLATHAPESRSGAEVGQLTQLVEPAPEHSRHVAWHAVHVATDETTSTNVPVLGHSETHEPECRKGVAVPVHERHSDDELPVHVPHEASHGSHMDELLANLPTGVHEARQLNEAAPTIGLAKG